VGREHNEVRVRAVYRKGEEEAQSVRKAVEGCGSSRKCSMSCFSSLSENGTKTQGGAGWVGRVSGKARTSAEEEARFGRGQASCGRQSMGAEGSGSAMESRQPSGSGRKTAGGNQSAGMSAGRNRSEALGPGVGIRVG